MTEKNWKEKEKRVRMRQEVSSCLGSGLASAGSAPASVGWSICQAAPRGFLGGFRGGTDLT